MRWLVVVTMVLGCGKSSEPSPRSAGGDRGRTEIVYEIDLSLAVTDKARELIRDLEAGFADEQIAAVLAMSGPPGAITITLADPARRTEVSAALKANHADLVESRDCAAADGPNAICIRISETSAVAVRKAALASAVQTVRARLAAKQLRDATVESRGETLVVELSTAALEARGLLERSGKLEFRVVEEGSAHAVKLYARVGDPASDPAAVAAGITAEIDNWRDDSGADHTDLFLVAPDREVDLPLPEALAMGCTTPPTYVTVRCLVAGRAAITRYLATLVAEDPSFAVPGDRELAFERREPSDKDPRPGWRSYLLERRAELTGSAIAHASATFDPGTGQHLVMLDFNRHGAQVFGDVTERLIGKKLAILLDGTIRSAPIVHGAIRGGRVSITMGGSDPATQEREANELVTVLKTGSLPAPLRERSRRTR